MFIRRFFTFILVVLTLVSSGCSPQEPVLTASPLPSTTPIVPVSTTTVEAGHFPGLHSLISQESLFTYVEALTSIQAYSGWRNSATQGETEALDYVTATLSEFTHLQELGLELERQSFHVYLATEVWESRLFITRDGQEIEVPVNALSGHRMDLGQALRFDSDGALNDADRDPVKVTGQTLFLRKPDDIINLAQKEAQGRIVFLDFKAVDPEAPGAQDVAQFVTDLIQKDVAGLVLVFSNGNGKYATDGTFLEDVTEKERIPMLILRLEDLAPAGIASWDDLAKVESVRLIWDTDVSSPGQSGNLVAHIPGADSSRAVIFGAHIDSANSPGAADNALNCAVLLEVARVLDAGAVLPPVDIYLVWFGSHELGLHGSQYFVNTHQELLDRTIGAFLMDGFTADQTGPTILAIQEASHALFGEARLPFGDYLYAQAAAHGISVDGVIDSDHISSDDGSFYGFVPAVRFAFGSNAIGRKFHSPYDTMESVQDQGEVMRQSVSMALIAALDMPLDTPNLHVTPEPERHALIVATHMEELAMTPTMLIHLDRALAWEGYNVDVVPYGQPLRSADLVDADLVLALPVFDYPSVVGDLTLYDEGWNPEEIELLVNYVESGGFLILTNSANRLFRGRVFEANEDWEDINALAAPLGISYGGEPFQTIRAFVTSAHPMMENLTDLVLLAHNGLPLTCQGGEVLAEAQNRPAICLGNYGGAGGQVLALSDLGMLDLYDPREGERDNLDFLRNLVRYASGR